MLDREQRSVERGAAITPIITGSSQSRTTEKRPPAKMALDFNRATSDVGQESKSPLPWNPPIAWASSMEQTADSLPQLDASQTESMMQEAEIQVGPSNSNRFEVLTLTSTSRPIHENTSSSLWLDLCLLQKRPEEAVIQLQL